MMQISELEGIYNIVGTNQDDTNTSYTGTLSLRLNTDGRLLAKWRIGSDQEQFGEGFFRDNILVINFHYYDEDRNIYKGVVVYRCISKDILDGFWSEEFGDPKCLGEERCFRVGREPELLN